MHFCLLFHKTAAPTKTQASLILWYSGCYGSMYARAISINFHCHIFNLTTTVP